MILNCKINKYQHQYSLLYFLTTPPFLPLHIAHLKKRLFDHSFFKTGKTPFLYLGLCLSKKLHYSCKQSITTKGEIFILDKKQKYNVK
jgi:hypothetical protein